MSMSRIEKKSCGVITIESILEQGSTAVMLYSISKQKKYTSLELRPMRLELGLNTVENKQHIFRNRVHLECLFLFFAKEGRFEDER